MAIIRATAEALGGQGGRVEVPITCDRVLRGWRHEDFGPEEARRLEGACLGLESACRQVGFSGARQQAWGGRGVERSAPRRALPFGWGVRGGRLLPSVDGLAGTCGPAAVGGELLLRG